MGVCGPDVTNQLVIIWKKIQDDFRIWPRATKEKAATRILTPIAKGGVIVDVMGWDTMPLYKGNLAWLLDPQVIHSGCAIPMNADDPESPTSCSGTVQVQGQCWLAGSVNYGTFGIMAKLSEEVYSGARDRAINLIKVWKGVNPFDTADVPIAWFNATYFDGPAGFPKTSGNCASCAPSCALTGDIVNWDYVWEPVKPRTTRTPDAIYKIADVPVVKMSAPPPAPVIVSAPAFTRPTTYTTRSGDSLRSISKKFYGDPNQWQKIYTANSKKVGPNPDLVLLNVELVIP